MQIRAGKAPRSSRLASVGVELSREARVRLSWMDFYGECGNVVLTCRHFGISRQTYYRWQKGYDSLDLASLEEHSHCPRRRRQPTWSCLLEERVLQLRLQSVAVSALGQRQAGASAGAAAWGGFYFDGGPYSSAAEAQRAADRTAPGTGVPGSRRALRPRPYAVRKPKQYAVSKPGDLVEVDTLDVRPVPGVSLQTVHRPRRDLALGRDPSPRPRHRLQTATQFLDNLATPHAVSDPRCPGRWWKRVRGRVRTSLPATRPPPVRAPAPLAQTQRRRRTRQPHPYRGVLSGHACSLQMNKLNRELRQWEKIYNTVRPHQALGYRTPLQFLRQYPSQRKE